MRSILFLFLLPGAALAAPVEEIVVTGRALPDLPGARAYGGVTLDAAALTPASGRLEDALRQGAGVQLFRRSDSRAANPTSGGATLRGLGGNAATRALVTLDGVPQADPFGGWVPWSALSQLPLGGARVTRGGGAGPFGAGALAGTISLASPAADANDVLNAQAGSRGGARGQGQAAIALGDGALQFGGGGERGDGFLLPPASARGAVDVPARYRQWAASARALAPAGQGELQARAAAFGDSRLRGLPGSDARSGGADASLRWIGRGAWAAEALAYAQLRRFSTRAVSANPGRDAATLTLDQFRTPALGWGGKLAVRPPLPAGFDAELGADLRGAEGETNERFRFIAGAPTRLRRAGGRSLSAGVYAEADAALSDALRLTGGARIDRWRLSDGRLEERDLATGAPTLAQAAADRAGWEPTARAGLLWRPLPAWTARAAAYAGWRLPTLNELHRPFRIGDEVTLANPALETERLRGAEAGVTWQPLATVSVGLTAYTNRLARPIANVTLASTSAGITRQRRNLRAIRSAGVEADARAAWGPWTLAATAALVRARVDDGPASSLTGRRPAQTPDFTAGASLGWERDGRAARLALRHAGAQWEDDLNSRRLRAATVVDADAALPLGRGMALTLAAENLLDAEVDVGLANGVPERGQPRTLWLGVRFGG